MSYIPANNIFLFLPCLSLTDFFFFCVLHRPDPHFFNKTRYVCLCLLIMRIHPPQISPLTNKRKKRVPKFPAGPSDGDYYCLCLWPALAARLPSAAELDLASRTSMMDDH